MVFMADISTVDGFIKKLSLGHWGTPPEKAVEIHACLFPIWTRSIFHLDFPYRY
jgi:hypothetical protein